MAQAIRRRIESTLLMTQATFQELTQNQLMIQIPSSFVNSNELMTQTKSFDSELIHASTLSHTYVLLIDTLPRVNSSARET